MNWGVDVVVKGRYYLLGDQLIIQGNLVEAGSNQVIHALDRVEGPKGRLAELLKSLTQEILGYWAVKDVSGIADSPPKYEAYQVWAEASTHELTDPPKCASLLQEAYRLDTTFYVPLFSLYTLYGKEGLRGTQDSILAELGRRVSSLSPWERLRFDELNAIRERDWQTLAKRAEQRYEQDSSDLQALNTAIVANNYINHPRKSLELLKSFDLVYLSRGQRELSWLETNLIFPNFQLENYHVVDSVAETYPGRKIPDALAVMHLKSLAHLDSIAKLDRYLAHYESEGLYNNSGSETPFYTGLIMLSDELYMMGKQDLLEDYVARLQDLSPRAVSRPKYVEGFIQFYRRDFSAAAQSWENEKIDPLEWPGWLRLTLQYDHLSRMGHSYALAGNPAQAQACMDKMAQLPESQGRDKAYFDYYRARIWAAMSEPEKAIRSLELAAKGGFFFYGPVRYASDPFLKPLFEEAAFKALIKPQDL
ncbi:MAG: hypothetical protein AAF804_03265 [Bacteroidota bacterium]